jgi:hypothetical protein
MGMTPTIPMTDNDDDDVREESITQQDDNKPAISTEQNLYPAMEQLVNAYLQLNIRIGESVIASHNLNLDSLLVFYM